MTSNTKDMNLSWYVPKANVDHTISGQGTAVSTLDHSATTPRIVFFIIFTDVQQMWGSSQSNEDLEWEGRRRPWEKTVSNTWTVFYHAMFKLWQHLILSHSVIVDIGRYYIFDPRMAISGDFLYWIQCGFNPR